MQTAGPCYKFLIIYKRITLWNILGLTEKQNNAKFWGGINSDWYYVVQRLLKLCSTLKIQGLHGGAHEKVFFCVVTSFSLLDTDRRFGRTCWLNHPPTFLCSDHVCSKFPWNFGCIWNRLRAVACQQTVIANVQMFLGEFNSERHHPNRPI
jgi:hypothetical protein